MSSFKDPSYQDRVGQSAKAKKKALDQLRSRPPRDATIIADRTSAALRRDAARREKALAKQASATGAAEAKAAEAAAIAAVPAPPTDAERKAARDARYAARKNRR
jgi:hypothetical protein